MPIVLVVDDDPTVREVAATYLRKSGLRVVEAGDGRCALELDQRHDPALVVLDLTLPGLDGLEVLARLRERRAGLPVLILTARDEEADRILGFEVGADDYLTKPFSARELTLRVQALLRRSGAAPAGGAANGSLPARLSDGDLALDRRGRAATRGGRPLPLTTREFDLLGFLLAHPGEAFSRTALMRHVWQWEYGDESTVTVHVRRLREKIETDPARPRRLVTVWGVGYRWDPS